MRLWIYSQVSSNTSARINQNKTYDLILMSCEHYGTSTNLQFYHDNTIDPLYIAVKQNTIEYNTTKALTEVWSKFELTTPSLILTDQMWRIFCKKFRRKSTQRAHTIILWPNPKERLTMHVSVLTMVRRWLKAILTLIKRDTTKLNTHHMHVLHKW